MNKLEWHIDLAIVLTPLLLAYISWILAEILRALQ